MWHQPDPWTWHQPPVSPWGHGMGSGMHEPSWMWNQPPVSDGGHGKEKFEVEIDIVNGTHIPSNGSGTGSGMHIPSNGSGMGSGMHGMHSVSSNRSMNMTASAVSGGFEWTSG